MMAITGDQDDESIGDFCEMLRENDPQVQAVAILWNRSTGTGFDRCVGEALLINKMVNTLNVAVTSLLSNEIRDNMDSVQPLLAFLRCSKVLSSVSLTDTRARVDGLHPMHDALVQQLLLAIAQNSSITSLRVFMLEHPHGTGMQNGFIHLLSMTRSLGELQLDMNIDFGNPNANERLLNAFRNNATVESMELAFRGTDELAFSLGCVCHLRLERLTLVEVPCAAIPTTSRFILARKLGRTGAMSLIAGQTFSVTVV